MPSCEMPDWRGHPLGTVGVAARRSDAWGTSYRRRFWRRGSRGRGHIAGSRGLRDRRVCIARMLRSADLLAVHPERTAHHRARRLVPTGTLPRLGCRTGRRCGLVGLGGLLLRYRLVGLGYLLPCCGLVGDVRCCGFGRPRGSAQRRRCADDGRGVGDSLAEGVDEIAGHRHRVQPRDQPRRGGIPRRDGAVIAQFHDLPEERLDHVDQRLGHPQGAQRTEQREVLGFEEVVVRCHRTCPGMPGTSSSGRWAG